jgi:hypothetical protein
MSMDRRGQARSSTSTRTVAPDSWHRGNDFLARRTWFTIILPAALRVPASDALRLPMSDAFQKARDALISTDINRICCYAPSPTPCATPYAPKISSAITPCRPRLSEMSNTGIGVQHESFRSGRMRPTTSRTMRITTCQHRAPVKCRNRMCGSTTKSARSYSRVEVETVGRWYTLADTA